MSAPLRPATQLRPAGPLTFTGFVGAIYHASTALQRDHLLPGTDVLLSIPQLWLAALSAVDPYCDGDRDAAVRAIAEALTPDWTTGPATNREHALARGRAVLLWLEGFDPARN